MNDNDVALICKALSDINRLNILKLIGSKELCACKLLEFLQINQSTLSYHMKLLSDCSLVNIRKDGKWSHYSLNSTQIDEFIAYLAKSTQSK